MLRSVWTKTLRDYRVAILGWGLGLALLLYATLAAYATQITTPQARAQFAQLAETFRFFAEPIEVTTPTGFATWRIMGLTPVLLGIWAILAGARLVRGAEERGTLDIVLATPRSRARVLAEGIAALVAALAIVGVLLGLGALAGEAAAGVPAAPGGAILAGLNVSLTALVFGLLALLLSQFVTRAGAAAGAAAGLMILAWVVDGTGRAAPDLAWVSRLSPFHLYGLSKPLIASYGADPGALLGLAALAAILGGASFPLFARRDLGGTAWSWRGGARQADGGRALAGAARDHSLRGLLPRALRADAPAIAWWTFGLALYVAWVTGVARATRDTLRAILEGSPFFRQFLGGVGLGTDAGFLSGVLFAFLPVLLALYALTQAGGWARDLDAGRLELVLGTPIPRWRVFLGSWGATLAALILAPLALWLVALVSFRAWGLQVDGGNLAAAFVGFLPLELTVAALVYALAGRLSAGAVSGLVGGLIALSFVAELLNSMLNLPAWIAGLSLFHQYGAPLLDGPRPGPWLALTALAAALLALGLAQFTRADLQRGG